MYDEMCIVASRARAVDAECAICIVFVLLFSQFVAVSL